MPEIIEAGGLLFDPSDADALVSAVLRLYENDTREQLKVKGAIREQGFHWDSVARKAMGCYRSLLNQRFLG